MLCERILDIGNRLDRLLKFPYGDVVGSGFAITSVEAESAVTRRNGSPTIFVVTAVRASVC